MFIQPPLTSRRSEEAERPFWISYADLMTAMMVLFLVIVVVTLSSLTRPAKTAELEKGAVHAPLLPDEQRLNAIATICDDLNRAVRQSVQSAHVDCKLNRINFGSAGLFKSDEYKLSPQGENSLRKIVPIILHTARSADGQKWLKRIVIVGFTDTDGSYLYNLNLSLKRSEWVMCKLLSSVKTNDMPFDATDRRDIRKLFLAGGVSFNDIQGSKDSSRRIELKLEFYGINHSTEKAVDYGPKFEDEGNEKCWI